MGLQYRRRKSLGRGTFLNISKSGMSMSKRIGRATFNGRGGGSIHIAKGLTFRWGRRR